MSTSPASPVTVGLTGSPASPVTSVDGVGGAGTGVAGGVPLVSGTSLVSGSPVPPDPAVPGSPAVPAASSAAASSSAFGGPARTQDGGQAAGFPMGGSGGAAAERERLRCAWMYEDEDVWGADGTDCVPPVIYGHDWQGPRA